MTQTDTDHEQSQLKEEYIHAIIQPQWYFCITSWVEWDATV